MRVRTGRFDGLRLRGKPRDAKFVEQRVGQRPVDRHRLRALQLKHWKRGRTIYRELRARGVSDLAARQVAANGRRWWHNSAMKIHMALPNKLFDELGVPRLAA